MKIVSLNLQGFFGWAARQPAIESYLAHERADVVLFQEVVYLPQVAPVPQPELLNRALRYPVRHEVVSRQQQSPEYGLYREGLAALSAHPVPASTTLVLPREAGDPHERIVQLLDVQTPDRLWLFANVHLSVRDDRAITQLRLILQLLEARGERRILVGDFNVHRLERHRAIWGADYELSSERFPVATFPGSAEGLDYLLVPSDRRLEHLEVSPHGLSDHLGIAATLR